MNAYFEKDRVWRNDFKSIYRFQSIQEVSGQGSLLKEIPFIASIIIALEIKIAEKCTSPRTMTMARWKFLTSYGPSKSPLPSTKSIFLALSIFNFIYRYREHESVHEVPDKGLPAKRPHLPIASVRTREPVNCLHLSVIIWRSWGVAPKQTRAKLNMESQQTPEATRKAASKQVNGRGEEGSDG